MKAKWKRVNTTYPWEAVAQPEHKRACKLVALASEDRTPIMAYVWATLIGFMTLAVSGFMLYFAAAAGILPWEEAIEHPRGVVVVLAAALIVATIFIYRGALRTYRRGMRDEFRKLVRQKFIVEPYGYNLRLVANAVDQYEVSRDFWREYVVTAEDFKLLRQFDDEGADRYGLADALAKRVQDTLLAQHSAN